MRIESSSSKSNPDISTFVSSDLLRARSASLSYLFIAATCCLYNTLLYVQWNFHFSQEKYTQTVSGDCSPQGFSSRPGRLLELSSEEVFHLHARHNSTKATSVYFNTYSELTKEINILNTVKEHNEA